MSIPQSSLPLLSLPADEPQRLAALYSLGILDTPPEERFDRLTRLATALFKVPIALISLVDKDRLWFKSAQGTPPGFSQVPRTLSFCAQAILVAGTELEEALVVPDAHEDEQFKDSPLVVSEPFIRFYAGHPLVSLDGRRLGTLCLVDQQPREFSDQDRATLRDLAQLAQQELNTVEINQWLSSRVQHQARLQLLESIVVNTKDAVLVMEAEPLNYPGPRIIYANPAFTTMTGYRAEEVLGQSPRLLQGSQTDRATLDKIRTALERWEPVVAELVNYRKDGTPFWVELSIVPIANERGWYTHWVSVQRDITERRRVEQEREESNQLYRTLTRNFPGAAVFVFDHALRYTLIECQEVHELGISSADLQGKTIWEAWPYAVAEELEARYRAALAGTSSVMEATYSGRHYLVYTLPVRNAQGQIFAGMVIKHNIQQLKQTQLLFARQNEVLELLATGATLPVVLENLTSAIEEQSSHQMLCSILLLDPPSKLPISPDATAPVLRFGAGLSLPKTYCQAIEGIAVGPKVGSCGTAAYTGQLVIVEDIATDPRWVDYRDVALAHNLRACWSSPIFSQTGLVLGTFAAYYREPRAPSQDDLKLIEIATHIAGIAIERKRAEETLAAEKEQLAVTLQSIGDGVITTDRQGRVVLLNAVAEKLTGWTQAEALGRPLAEVFVIVHETTGSPMANPVQKVLESSEIGPLEHNTMLVARDGSQRRLADSAAPIRNTATGQVRGVVLIFRDITNQYKLEQELIRAQKLESVGVLAGGIAHDFNNLLTSIVGSVSLAQMDVAPGDHEMTELLDMAQKAALRARDLTQQLLTFAKGGAPIKKLIKLPTVLKEAAEFALHGAGVHSKIELASTLWPLEADEGQLSQVIQNLILNAVQAMPQGGQVKLSARNRLLLAGQVPPLEEGYYVEINVSDQGVGIAPENLSRIFDPYFTTKAKGHGLGLAAVYSIIRNHAGIITLESKLNVGTTFRLYLPAAAHGEVAPGLVLPSTNQLSPSGQGRILVMEDDAGIREVIQAILKRLGYEVWLTRDGEEALAQYLRAQQENQPFDAVLLDLTIAGGMGGEATLKALKVLDPEVRAVVSSGYSTNPVMSNYLEYGFAGVVTKPYNLEELQRVLSQVLRPTHQQSTKK